MACAQCQGIERFFNRRMAERELKAYRERGPDTTTRLLLEALRAEGVAGQTLLDIGGGIGVIQLELLEAGVTTATDVDASSAYLAVARSEAERDQLAERVAYQHGDFVDLAPNVAPSGIVTLDRVICCYHDMRALVSQSAAKATRLYGLVYPRDTWYTRAIFAVSNQLLRLQGTAARLFVHPTAAVDALIRDAGLERRHQRDDWFWQVVVYARTTA